MRGEDQKNSGPTGSKLCTLLKNRSMTTLFVCEEKGGKVCTLHRNLFHLLNDLVLIVSSQIIKTSKTDTRERVKLKGTDGEKHLQAMNSPILMMKNPEHNIGLKYQDRLSQKC